MSVKKSTDFAIITARLGFSWIASFCRERQKVRPIKNPPIGQITSAPTTWRREGRVWFWCQERSVVVKAIKQPQPKTPNRKTNRHFEDFACSINPHATADTSPPANNQNTHEQWLTNRANVSGLGFGRTRGGLPTPLGGPEFCAVAEIPAEEPEATVGARPRLDGLAQA